MKTTLLISLVLSSTLLCAQDSKTILGPVVKSEFNFTTELQQGESNSTVMQNHVAVPLGVMLSHKRAHLGYDFSVLFSGAKYDINYVSGTNTFNRSEIKFIEYNANVNFFPGAGSSDTRGFLFAGAQLLSKRYGVNYFVNNILSNAIWPQNAFMLQMGAGADFSISKTLELRMFGGVRMNPSAQKVVYDRALNQLFLGATLGFSLDGNGKSKALRCFQF